MRLAMLLVLALGSLCAVAGSASADTYTVCDSIPRTTFQDVTLTLDIPEFPFQDCYLIDAVVTLDVKVDGRFFGENTGNCGPAGCAWRDSIYASVSLSDLNGAPLFSDFSFVDSGTVTGYDGVLDFGGTSGYTSPYFWTPYASFVMTYPDLSIFDTPVPVTIDAEAWTQLMNPGNGAYGVATYIEAKVCVTYTFECATSVEPATWGAIKRQFQ